MQDKALKYIYEVLQGEKPAPMYVKKQLKEISEIAEGKNKKYVISESKVKKISALLKLMIMPSGRQRGKKLYDCLVGFQWVLIYSALCVVHRSEPKRRRYTNIILEIARKNGKTFIVAVFFLLLLLVEPKFSKVYSVAPDGAVSREVKEAIEKIIESSPALQGTIGSKAKFKVLRDYIKCNITKNKFIPLNFSTSRMDSREPNIFLCDETGALPTPYPIEAMRSGQTNVENPLGFIISTKYPTSFNPFEEEVEDAKKILDGLKEDEKTFSLLFEPDDKKNWADNDEILEHANPLAVEVPEVMESLKEKRQKAIDMPSRRENFVTKHCNIIFQGISTETFVSIDSLQKCKVNNLDWTGRKVYVGLDLAMTTDNCAVAIAAFDEYTEGIIADIYAFIPEDKVEEKTRVEKVDYKSFINAGKCIACGDSVVDYETIENFILNIEEKFQCEVAAVGYDRYNALSTAQKIESAGMDTVIIKQHSSVLHPAIKLLEEKILKGQFQYEENKMFEINVENARCTYDTNLNRYLNKKRSVGKIDMLMALVDAVYLIEQNEVLNNGIDIGGMSI